jgi:hypothetical protein
VALEMVRVIRPGGKILVVDYALPRNPVAAWFAFHFVKLYERDHYAEFVRSDLRALLRRVGVEVEAQRSGLAGLVSIYTGHRREVSDAAAYNAASGFGR